MRSGRKRTAVRAVFLYVLLTCGLWMFLNCCSNSYNRLSGDKIEPAELDVTGNMAFIGILEHEISLDLTAVSPESRVYCAAFLLAPDEIRSACYLISFCNGL